MEFDAADFLGSLFDETTPRAPEAKLVVGEPVLPLVSIEEVGFGEVIDPPACPQCGRFEMWQTAMGNWRCLRCDPPKVAIRALERVQRIRRRLGMPARPETGAMLADLRRLTAQDAHSCVAGEVVAA